MIMPETIKYRLTCFKVHFPYFAVNIVPMNAAVIAGINPIYGMVSMAAAIESTNRTLRFQRLTSTLLLESLLNN